MQNGTDDMYSILMLLGSLIYDNAYFAGDHNFPLAIINLKGKQ